MDDLRDPNIGKKEEDNKDVLQRLLKYPHISKAHLLALCSIILGHVLVAQGKNLPEGSMRTILWLSLCLLV